MTASRMQCWLCGTAFFGRADARYCSAACRQKAHRARTARRAAQAIPAPELSNTTARARKTRQAARAARERSAAARRVAAETLAALDKSSQ